ncbi:hypothetical protein pipiens_003903 [Culex pipiens pipiens]|uniref:BAH domain-containing protein n=1 Tax=Culex pipiens pipiens TaxID=38569 RepID=A0ABD1CR15_CULPP
MYRVGDYVYVETSSTTPFQIRRIEELNKTPSGNVEAKMMCFYRRRDLPTPLSFLAPKKAPGTASLLRINIRGWAEVVAWVVERNETDG